MEIIKGLYYTKDHEWVKIKGDIAYIGVTDYAQHALGDIVFVELPEIDSEFYIEDSFAVVESVKAASDVFIPISGTVCEINEALEDSPELLNSDPFENFIIGVKGYNQEELEDLMDADEYKDYCEGLE